MCPPFPSQQKGPRYDPDGIRINANHVWAQLTPALSDEKRFLLKQSHCIVPPDAL